MKTPKNRPTMNRANRRWPIPAIVVMCFIVYFNALPGGFVWDDQAFVLRNADIRSFSNLPRLFVSSLWQDVDHTQEVNYYRPLQVAFYMLAYQMGGADPKIYHLLNFLFHVVTCVFVYLICLELRIDRFASFFASALFAVHPVHTEAVTWISAPDSACGLFYMASIWMSLRYLSLSKRAWVWASAAAFFLALLFKEMAISVPVMVFVLLMFSRRNTGFRIRQTVREIGPYAVAGALYLTLRIEALGRLYPSRSGITGSMLDLFTLELRVFGQYIQYALLPYPLAIYHMIPLQLSNRVEATLIYAILVATVAVAGWLLRKRFPEVSLWMCLFVVMLAPALNLRAISLAFLSERYLYIPTLATVICAALLVGRLKRTLRLAVAISWVLLFSGMTIARNRDWLSEEKLFASEIAVYPEAAIARIKLGDSALQNGDDRRAEAHFKTVLTDISSGVYIHPSGLDYRAYVGLAAVAARARKYDEARTLLLKAAAIEPNDPGAYTYLGGIEMDQAANYEAALKYLRKAVELGPGNEVAHDYLGSVLFNMGRYQEAAEYFEDALRINPNFKDAQTHLEMVKRKLSGGH